MNYSSPIAQAALRRAIPSRVRHACQTVLGVLMALTFMASTVYAGDLPDGWGVRPENNGATFAPIKMNSGEQFEIWVAGSSYQVPPGASLQSQLPQIRLMAGATQGDKCQPPEVTQDNLVAQNCKLGDSTLTYMLLLPPQSGNKAQLLSLHTAGSDEALARYNDNFQQIMQIVIQGRSLAVLRSEGSPADIAQAIRTAPGQGVQDGDIAAVFVTSQAVSSASETVSRTVHTTWLLLKGGTAYKNTIPPDELNVKVSRQLEPQRWVQWRKSLSGNGYEFRGSLDKDWLDLQGWIAQPARSGERLNGTYERTDFSGSMFAVLTSKTYDWYFRNDGTYETSFNGNSGYVDLGNNFGFSSSTVSNSKGTNATTGATSTTDQTGGGTSSAGTYTNNQTDDGASRRGRYQFNGWVLELERDDGQADRYFVTFRDDKRNMIDLNSNWFELQGN